MCSLGSCIAPSTHNQIPLVRARNGRHRLALLLIQRRHGHSPVANLRLGLILIEPRQRMLHPFAIQTLREIITGVRATRLRTLLRRVHRLHGVGDEIAEFERFDEVSVPDDATVGHADVFEVVGGRVKFLDALVERGLSAEDGSVVLHALLEGSAHGGRGQAAVGIAQPVQIGDRLGASVLGQRWEWSACVCVFV